MFLKRRKKIKEVIEQVLIISFFFILPIILMIHYIWFVSSTSTPPSYDLYKEYDYVCTITGKLYKDDLLFDNFYVSCNNETFEVDRYIFSKIEEGKAYRIKRNTVRIYEVYPAVEKVEE